MSARNEREKWQKKGAKGAQKLEVIHADQIRRPYAHYTNATSLTAPTPAYEDRSGERALNQSQRIIQMICICLMALIAMTTFVIWKSATPDTTPALDAELSPEELGIVNASDVVTVRAVATDADHNGRAYATVSVENDADTPYVVRLTANITVAGIDERGEAWEGELTNVRLESFDEGCVWDGNALAVTGLGANARKTVDVYPSLADTKAIRGVTLTSIQSIEIVTQTATPTSVETKVSTTEDTSISCELTDEEGVIRVYGTANTRDVEATGGIAYVALIDRQGNLPEGTTDENCKFTYGCNLRAIRFTCDSHDSRIAFGDSFATGGKITRARLIGIVFD